MIGRGHRLATTDLDIIYEWLQAGREYDLPPCRVHWLPVRKRFRVEVYDREVLVGFGNIGGTRIVSRHEADYFTHADDALMVAGQLRSTLRETQEWCMQCHAKAILHKGMMTCPVCMCQWTRE